MESVINDLSLLGDKEKLLTKKQAAAEFGISYRTLERWYNNGYIDRIRIGGRIYFAYSEIYRLRDRFLGGTPNGNYLESQIKTFDDVFQRHELSNIGMR